MLPHNALFDVVHVTHGPGINRRVPSFNHQATTLQAASLYRRGVNLCKQTDALGDTGDAAR